MKRIAMDRAAFSSSLMAEQFAVFGQWLGREVGAQKAALTIHRHVLFFTDIERQWRAVPGFDALLAHFGTARLRRAHIPMRWLEVNGLVAPDARAKQDDSDRRRIAATLERPPKGSPERTLLAGYHGVLMAELGEGITTLRSVRLALSPAAALLLKARALERMPPDQEALNAYLRGTPGQRAALSGFVGYLRAVHGALLVVPKRDPEKARRNRKRKLEADMLALSSEGGDGTAFRRRWLSVTLAYFHDLPRSVGKALRDDQIATPDDGGLIVTVEGEAYWVPALPDQTSIRVG